MIYTLLDQAPKDIFTLKGELFKYLIKVRRHDVGDILSFRSKEDTSILYKAKLTSIDNRKAEFSLVSQDKEELQSEKKLHIGWCMIDTKSIEKVLPSLNEIGVAKISFIECARSQKNFKLDMKRLVRILEASMQQCGRSTYMEFDTYSSLEAFLQEYPDTKIFDFCENILEETKGFERVLIGCEGGFSQEERDLFEGFEKFKLDTSMVLRSESAALAVASKILL